MTTKANAAQTSPSGRVEVLKDLWNLQEVTKRKNQLYSNVIDVRRRVVYPLLWTIMSMPYMMYFKVICEHH